MTYRAHLSPGLTLLKPSWPPHYSSNISGTSHLGAFTLVVPLPEMPSPYLLPLKNSKVTSPLKLETTHP